jgi:uncharacterized protein YyaL (SSP411 family)
VSNRLANETSPYLRQHQDNPVDWYAWGDEAFAEARASNRPILLSVGYSACHWCHVMAHECFEDDEVAGVMNRLFVNVKVDREERPDVDAIYMEAVQAMTGRGGWPMTAFLTPEGRPFYGGTYFPKPQFLQLMAAIDDVWRNKPDDVKQNVDALMTALRRTSTLKPTTSYDADTLLNSAVQALAKGYDPQWGGFGKAPKFPGTMSIDLVLRSHVHHPSEVAVTIATTSLDAMAAGGMYDHIGGGFARYSTDERWLVPHFEKMLYDQALLVRVYLHGYLVLGHTRWAQVVEETIGYVLRDMTHPDGGFFSAEDADSPDEHGHGHEGLFHTWTPDEVRAVLGPDAEAALAWYDITDDGNFDGRSIPHRSAHRTEVERPDDIERARAHLFEAREQRSRPGLDDKVLTEWNALMLSSLAEAAAAFDRPDWLEAAVRNGEFLLAHLRRADGRWHRSWQVDGAPPARHHALAADHAALVDAFTRLAEATGEARWIDAACEVADTLLDHFWDTEAGGVFTTADDAETLVVRQKDLMDDATPSANSTAALAFQRLGALTGERRYVNHADQILRLLAALIPKAPTAFAQALAAIDLRRTGTVEVVVVGDRPDLVRVVQSTWQPRLVLAWGEPYESPLWAGRVAGSSTGQAYVCVDHTCQLPTADADDLRAQLSAP